MNKETTKVKVIEVVGQKLDPNAKYIFMVHQAAMSEQELGYLADALTHLIGPKFVIGFTNIPVNESMKVFEVAPKDQIDRRA